MLMTRLSSLSSSGETPRHDQRATNRPSRSIWTDSIHTLSLRGADNPASRSHSSRFCFSKRGRLVLNKMEKEMLLEPLFSTSQNPPFFETSAGSTCDSLVHREKKAGCSEEPRHPAMYLLDTRWKPMHNAMRVREGTVTITGSHPHSRWSLCAQGHSILSQYQALYPAILD